MSPLGTSWNRFASLVYQDSLIHRTVGRIRFFGRHPFDDDVSALKARPLAMFFYNQRAVFLGVGLLFLLSAITLLLLTAHPPAESGLTVLVLGLAWTIDFLTTLALHRSFRRRINQSVASPVSGAEQQPIFDRYFRIDALLVILLILFGRFLNLSLDAFVSLLFANTVVYSSAYVRGGPGNRRQVVTVLSLLVVITLLLLFGTHIRVLEPRALHLLVNLGAIVGMAMMTLLSVLMISWLRTDEQQIAERRLGLLGRYQKMLSEGEVESSKSGEENEPQYSERQFRNRVRELLRSVCNLGYPFWYDSACLWLRETHKDRGEVLLPAAVVDFKEARDFNDGLNDPEDGLLDSTNLVLLHSLRHRTAEGQSRTPRFRADLNAPAAFIPLIRSGKQIGVLALYGKENGATLFYDEKAFLWSLGALISNTMEQWEGRYRARPLKEMDELFGSNSLKELLPKAVKILKKYLEANGCMVIFRPDPKKPEMEVSAVDGFSDSIIRRDIYLAGVGQTGKSAATGSSIRYDHVPSHRDDFDESRLRSLEKAHRKPIISWMAIPIGGKDDENFGVIKVVNSTFRCSWFTQYDVDLGEDLARRLHVMIEKFLHIKEIEESQEIAQANAQSAKRAQETAEAVAKQRQEDLMIITHQLQGPLSSLIGSISYLQTKPLPAGVRAALDDLEALVEDSIAVCYGTFTTFALVDGRRISFVTENINGPQELRKLCRRLQRTNSRPDLTFSYFEENDFPVLRLDRSVFTSVIYSLVHNAMKYAEEDSRVILECSVERSSGEAALKVKSEGQPILQNETERIFEKFSRGQLSETTGRRYSGVGLGLWVARGLMRAIGGDLTVEISVNNPRFSVFVVHFPQMEGSTVSLRQGRP
jgi:signal transduction histidine kinase